MQTFVKIKAYIYILVFVDWTITEDLVYQITIAFLIRNCHVNASKHISLTVLQCFYPFRSVAKHVSYHIPFPLTKNVGNAESRLIFNKIKSTKFKK